MDLLTICLICCFIIILATAFAVISGLIILIARFAFATYAYVSSHDGDWNIIHIFRSHEFWDMSESSYWEWAAITCACIWGIILLVVIVIWLINFCCRSLLRCSMSDGVSWIIGSSEELSRARTLGLTRRHAVDCPDSFSPQDFCDNDDINL